MTLISQNLAEISVILSFTNPFCNKNLPGLGAHKLLQQRWFSYYINHGSCTKIAISHSFFKLEGQNFAC